MALKKVTQTVWKKTKFRPEEARKQLDKMGADAAFIYNRIIGELNEPDIAQIVGNVSKLKIANVLRIMADAHEFDHYTRVAIKCAETNMRFGQLLAQNTPKAEVSDPTSPERVRDDQQAFINMLLTK